MEFKAKDIAALLKGVVEGDGEVMVNNVSKIEEGKPNTLAFLANPKYEHYIYTTAASVVLVNHDFSPVQQVPCTLIRVPSAYEAIASLLQMYDSMRSRPTGIELLISVKGRLSVKLLMWELLLISVKGRKSVMM